MLQFAQITTPAHSALISFLTGPTFFIALIAGVAMAFAFQFLLSNLSIAVGISAGINPAETDAEGWGKKVRRVEAKVGTATIAIVSAAVFAACFLAVRLTFIQQALLGATIALVIWSIYFLLLIWTGSRAIGALAETIGSTASSSMQGVMSMAGTALGGQAVNRQIVNTVESSVDVVSKELRSAFSADQVQENLENYLAQLPLPEADLKEVPNQVLNLLSHSNLLSEGRSQLVDLLKSATSEDLESGRLRQRLTELLGLQEGNGNSHSEGNSKKQGVGLRERTLQMGIDALLSTLTERDALSRLSNLNLESLAKPLGSSVEKLGAAFGQQVSQIVDTVSRSYPAAVIRSDIERYLLESPGWYLQPENLDRGFREVLFDPDADAALIRQQLEPIGRGYFAEVLSHRDGMNPDEIQDIADELEVIRQEVLDQVRSAEEDAKVHALRHQVEDYLRSAAKDSLLAAESLEQDFMGLLADPEATYELLGNRLVQFDRDTLMQLLLAGRQDLSPEETEQILNNLEGARDRFLNQSQESWNQLQTQTSEFQQRVESYLRGTNPAELTVDAIQQVFHNLSSVPEVGSLAVRMGLGQLDRSRLQQILAERQDINPDQVNQLLDQVESIRDRLLHAPQELTEQAKEQLTQVTDRIAEYLRNTQLEELNPEGIRRDLQQLFDDPQSGFSALGARLAHVDRETLVKLLSQRQDLSEEQVNQVIDQVQDALQSIVRLPRQLTTRTRERVQDLSADFASYLRNTKREELNPEGIQRDLQRLFQQPREGAEQLRERLSHIDRDTIVALLAQREDLTEEEANRIVDQVLGQVESIRDRIVQQAQAIKEQVQATAAQANENVRGYLNSLDRPELNYEGIQQDIRKLFADPEAGFEALRDRLGQFDRETLVALLSSRSDISEEQANKIVDQIELARDAVLSRAERIQSKAEERIQALKHQAKAQAEEVQKISAATAWWVFGTALSSMAAAAIAGVLATGY